VAPVTPSPPLSTSGFDTAPVAFSVTPVTPSPSSFLLLPDTALAASNLACVTPSTIDLASLPEPTDNLDVAPAHVLNPQAVEFNPQHSTTDQSCVYPVTPSDGNFIRLSSLDTGPETIAKSTADTDLPDHLQVLFLTTVQESKLNEDTTQSFKQLLTEHQHTFAKDSIDIGFCPLMQHDIDTGDAPPTKQSPRRPLLAALDAEDTILDEMLSTGVSEPSSSEWASPVCLVKKKDGTYRFCVNYRRVNAVSRRDAFPVTDIQDALDSLRGAQHFVTIDLLSGYWQLGMTERAKQRFAFCTRRGLYCFNRMPFGLSGAPSTFCRLMSNVLSDFLWRICLCYLDDIVIYARTQAELLERIHMVLLRLRHVGLKVKQSKCEFFKTEIHFLGHLISNKSVQPLPHKVAAIKEWPTPHCLRDVRAFYGLASYYRKFVKSFATIAEPLTRLTKRVRSSSGQTTLNKPLTNSIRL